MRKNAKIYIAGHRGLVGSAILRNLLSRGYTNIITSTSEKLDLRNQKQTEEFFNKKRPEYVFLCAAKVGGILANYTYPAEFIYDNIMISTNVIHTSYKYKVKKLLNFGSSCIYPKYTPQPIKESYLLKGELEPTNEAYAIAKIAALKLCKYYNQQYKTNYLSVMPTNLYGPGDNFDLNNSHVLASIIHKFHLAKLLKEKNIEEIKKCIKIYWKTFNKNIDNLQNKTLIKILNKTGIYSDRVVLWGSGSPYREFLYIDDLANVCIFIMEKINAYQIGDFINIGTGQDLQIKRLAKLVARIVGFKGDISWDRSKPDGTLRKRLDISQIKKLGWEPTVSLEEGIINTYNWFLKNLSESSRTL